jgi:D-sedoheptulose 7-phosphate isomerase
MPLWQPYVDHLNQTLSCMQVSDGLGRTMDTDIGMDRWLHRTMALRENRGFLFLVGNGASSSIASHFSADLAKNAGIRTQWLTEASLMTAVANDISYERVFAEPLSWWMQPDDMLVTISSSGNSLNIIHAIETARQTGGYVVTVSAMASENQSRRMGDLNFYLPVDTYGLAESGHTAILHCWMDMLEKLY